MPAKAGIQATGNGFVWIPAFAGMTAPCGRNSSPLDLVDVGFGDCFREPVAIADSAVEDVSGRYRVKALNSDHAPYLISM